MPTRSELETNPSAWSAALKDILDQKLVPIKELADIAGIGSRHLYYVANQQASLAHDKAERVSRYMESKYGVTSLAETHNNPAFIVLPRVFGKANGSAKDELIRIVKAVTAADNCHEELDKEGMKEAIDALREALADLEAEWAQL